jgi:alpha-1,3-rhamnosyl/mannosyltransferase
VAGLGDGPVIAYPAATYPHKDHATLIGAASRLASRHPGLQLVLTGGAGRAERAVSRLVEQAGPGLRVVRPGRVPASTVVSLLARADVLAFPSTYEGFGLPVLEAMRLGTPVVAAAATALPEVVGDAALLPGARELDEWVDALDAVLADASLRRRLVGAGRARSEEYAPDKAADRLLAAWRDCA